MIHEEIATAATLEEAQSAAIAKLNAPADSFVQCESTCIPEKKKILGIFGGSPAMWQVRAFYESNDPAPAKTPEKTVKTPAAPAEVKAPKENKSKANDASFAKAEAYLRMILENLGITDCSVSFEDEDEELKISIECAEDYGSVIGRRGETLDAIQYLTRLVINKGDESYKRISLNIGDYREKRETTLRALAKKNAAKVKKYGRNVVLDPMNPYERRIIHTTIQEIEGVTSHSVGSDGDRKVVISLEEGFKPTNGYDRRGGKGGRDNRGRGGRQSRPAYTPEANNRPPRSDSASASLYGKIEVNKD